MIGMRVLKPFLAASLVILIVCAIGAAVLIHRGFRANETPSTAEANLARSVRDLAIPRDERSLKNPFETNFDAIQQARDTFLSRCAMCHGFDGVLKLKWA